MSDKIFKEDDYLATSNYQNKPQSSEHSEFSVFTQDGQSYFALLDASGAVVLRSEAYASEVARNKGIASVKTNMGDISRWSIAEKMGYYFLVLKAANHQEIGRSGAFRSNEDAEASYGQYITTGSMAATSALSRGTETKPDALMPEAKEDVLKAEAKEDDYLSCKEYVGHPINDKENNVALFKHENGQFYFALYNADGSVKLRSEGFETAKNRDQELSGVLKYHNDDDMYSMLEKGKYFMMVLKDKDGTEVGRSCLQKNEKSTIAEIVSEPVVVSTRITNVTTNAAKDDDYLKCEAYLGHEVTDKENNIALFTTEDEQLYFAVYNPDGSVRLRSEGFLTEAGRDNELKAVIEHMNDPNKYSIIKQGKYSIKVLKDILGREVARSCMYIESEL